ncbi:MAG TPA: PLP-dependent transferase, partial [Cryomorphaceae bacterium]|nr:PLP-dependent transferase [Cryomorphaceae bacterium]
YTSFEDPAKVEALMNENTKLVWVETPTNPMLNIIDIEAISALTKDTKAILAVDNTFSTPYVQRPLELGADIVMHSITKYIGGHSDVVMGALVTANDDVASEMYRIQNSSGAICGPQDAFLVLRGIKTLHLRMQRHCENGQAVAEHLNKHPAVSRVFYAGLPDHPNHDVARRQMNGFTGMLSFRLKNDSREHALRVVSKFKVFALAESLGGVESLVGHPATMTHASIPADIRRSFGISDSLIRLSVGVEDIDDLRDDIDQVLG